MKIQNKISLSIVLPCLNEAKWLNEVITSIKQYLDCSMLKYSEIVVSDNNSTDNSKEVAIKSGARVVLSLDKGYGNALKKGFESAKYNFVLMLDADGSYDLMYLKEMITKIIEEEADMVIGNRFKGKIEDGAMPFLNRYIGNPILSFIGRIYNWNVRDFHCGIRLFNKNKVLDLDLESGGMEFASEMIIKASLAGLKIIEVKANLSKDLRDRPPHLKIWRDGFRHLLVLVKYLPARFNQLIA